MSAHTSLTSALDDFWANVNNALGRCATANTVEEVITILNEHFEPSAGDAFFGGGGGDDNLIDTLYWDRNDGAWTMIRCDADYYWCLQDTNGDQLTYIEGDVYRGNTMTD